MLCAPGPCRFFFGFMAPKHASVRTTAEWVAWAKTEGFIDIAEEYNGITMPGKVYCTLCSKWLGANSATIKQHCVEYKVGSGDKQEIRKSAHAMKVARRQQQSQHQQPSNPVPTMPPTIVVNVQAPVASTPPGVLVPSQLPFTCFLRTG